MLSRRHVGSFALSVVVFGLAGTAGAVPGRAIDLDSSYHHSCAVTDCGDIVCWGRNDHGQAIDRIITSGWFINTPDAWTDVSTGFFHTCGVDETGDAYCWGNNTYGQLDLVLGSDVMQVAAGGYHSCELIGINGEVFCTGYDLQGQASPPLDFFFDISAGAYHTCGVRLSGDILCWGSDSHGQSYGHQPTPKWAMFPGEEFVDVEAGNYHTCGLTDHGSVYCWGAGGSGQLHPVEDDGSWGEVLPGFWRTAGNFDVLDVGVSGTCSLIGNGIDCWGAPFSSGGGYTPPGGFAYDDVAVGAGHACAADTSGSLMCWGSSSYGKTTPDPVTGGACPVEIDFVPKFPPGPLVPWGG